VAVSPFPWFPIETNPAKRGDFAAGRRLTAVDTIVLHTTEGGTIAGAKEWWDREDVVASAHFIIDGKRIVQCVAEGDTAYHCGNGKMHRRSVGVEVVGHCANPAMWTDAVVKQLVELCAYLVRNHQIPILHQAGPGICGHCDVPDPYRPGLYGGASHHTDPGKHFPWDRFLLELRAADARLRAAAAPSPKPPPAAGTPPPKETP
jgi:N-acetyl-anhydromuramyl-L-alanine amidase AmpD